VGVVSHDVQLSTDGGTNFITLQTGLAGNVQEVMVNVGNLGSERAKVKIVARDARNNAGADESDRLFAIAAKPVISDAKYNDAATKLTIQATGVSAATMVEINGRAINLAVKFKSNRGILILRGDRNTLGLQSGENLVVVRERGLISAAFRFTLN
jgi:hypothetical protein